MVVSTRTLAARPGFEPLLLVLVRHAARAQGRGRAGGRLRRPGGDADRGRNGAETRAAAPRVPGTSLRVPGRRGQYANTAPESPVRAAARGGAGGRLRRPGGDAGRGRNGAGTRAAAPRVPGTSLRVPGRRGQYANTAPESPVRAATRGGAGGRLRRPGGDAGRGREVDLSGLFSNPPRRLLDLLEKISARPKSSSRRPKK